MEFVNFMMTHDWAMALFLVGTYLLMMAMILPVAFVPDRQKGNKLIFTLHSGSKAVLNLGKNAKANISASSDEEFKIDMTMTTIESVSFNTFTHTGTGFVYGSGPIVLIVGDTATVEITAENEMALEEHSTITQKYAAVMASILLLGIWSFLGWLLFSLSS